MAVTKRTQRKRNGRSTGAIVESAIRKVMDEVENELPDKQGVWMELFVLFAGMVLKDEEALTDRHLDLAGLLADKGLEMVDTRFPGVL